MLAKTRNAEQLGDRTRPLAADLIERAVVHDHKSGNALLLGRSPTPLSEIIAQFGVNIQNRSLGRSRGWHRDRWLGLPGLDEDGLYQPFRFTPTGVARAAGLPFRILSKMQTNLAMSAAPRVGKAADGAPTPCSPS